MSTTILKGNGATPAPARRGRPPRYGFAGLEVGDGLVVEGDAKARNAARSAAQAWGKVHKCEFSARHETDPATGAKQYVIRRTK